LVRRIRSDPVLQDRTNSRHAGDVLIQLTRDSGVALHRQIEASIRDGIRAGRLPRGTSLPPTRGLAAELGVSRGVVVEAYQQLVAEGYLASRPGGYTRVAIGPERIATALSPAPERAPRIDFCPCRADGSQFPRAAWLRSMRRVLTEASAEEFGYVSGRGAPALHHALAEYLNRVRGTSASPEAIVVCNGYAQGIALIIQVLAKSGASRLAVEDPSADDDAVPVARAAGLEVVGVPVDANGIRVDALDRVDADALILTPSHQWPTGAVLAVDRRAAALRWAQRRDALIVEDDYDAEYRYDRTPIGAVQGLAPDRVVYAGTASKTLAPGLRLGWLVAPPAARGRHRGGEDARRSRLAGSRPAGVRRLPAPRRVRPPSAPDAPAVPPPSGRAPRRPARARPGSRAGRDRRRPASRRLPAGRPRRSRGGRCRSPAGAGRLRPGALPRVS